MTKNLPRRFGREILLREQQGSSTGELGVLNILERPGLRKASRRVPQPWTLVHLSSLVLVAVLLSVWDSHMTWFSDDWSFLDRSRSLTGAGPAAVLASYNQHWSTVPVIIYRAILATFSMRSYFPFAVPLIAAHVANLTLTRTLMLKSGAPPGLATVLPLLFLFPAAAYTDVLWGFPFNLVGSATLGLCAALLASSSSWSRGRALAVAAVLLTSTATSNVGIAMTAAVALYVLMVRGWRQAALVASLPAAGFIVWFVTWGHREPSVCPGPISVLSVPAFVARAAEKGLSGLVGFSGGSLLVLALLVLGVSRIWRDRRWRSAAWPVSSAAGCLGLYLLSAVGRSACEVDASRAPRYAYFALLAVPLLGVALDVWWRRSRATSIAILSAALIFASLNLVHMGSLYECRKIRVDDAFAQLSYLSSVPSVMSPQATTDELAYLKARYGLRLPPTQELPPPAQSGC